MKNNWLFQNKISIVAPGDSLSSWACPNRFWLLIFLHQPPKRSSKVSWFGFRTWTKPVTFLVMLVNVYSFIYDFFQKQILCICKSKNLDRGELEILP